MILITDNRTGARLLLKVGPCGVINTEVNRLMGTCAWTAVRVS